MEGSLTVMTSNWVVAWIVFWAMLSGILSRSNSSFGLTLTFQVFDLIPDTFIYLESNNGTEDLNNVGSDAISRADILITIVILWSLLLQVSPLYLMCTLYPTI